MTVHLLSYEMAVSERKLFGRIKSIMGVTPNKYILIIRLQMAKEAIESENFHIVAEIANSVVPAISYGKRLCKCVDVPAPFELATTNKVGFLFSISRISDFNVIPPFFGGSRNPGYLYYQKAAIRIFMDKLLGREVFNYT